MIGYHYTTLDNYQDIAVNGLIPEQIVHEDLDELFPALPRGIWLWKQELDARAELGFIISLLSRKLSPEIVKLLVEYNSEDMLYYNGNRTVSMTHRSAIGDWQYADKNAKALITLKAIPPKKIHLEKVFNLMEIVKDNYVTYPTDNRNNKSLINSCIDSPREFIDPRYLDQFKFSLNA